MRRKKLEFQYYYKQDVCSAKDSIDVDCKCWHDEGSGPYASERHDVEVPLVDWRIKTFNAKLSGAPKS